MAKQKLYKSQREICQQKQILLHFHNTVILHHWLKMTLFTRVQVGKQRFKTKVKVYMLCSVQRWKQMEIRDSSTISLLRLPTSAVCQNMGLHHANCGLSLKLPDYWISLWTLCNGDLSEPDGSVHVQYVCCICVYMLVTCVFFCEVR